MTCTAQNRGAGNPARVRESFRRGLTLGLCYYPVILAAVLLLKKPFVRLLAPDKSEAIVRMGVAYLSVKAWFYLLPCVLNAIQGWYRGLDRMLLILLTPFLWVTALVLILCGVLAYRLAQQITKPINAIDLDNPIAGKNYAELSPFLNRIQEQNRTIRKQMSELSLRQREFTAITENMTAAAAAAPEPEQQLLLAGEAYRACRASFLPSPHLVPAALLLAGSRLREDAFPGTARRAKALFDSLGAEHPFITGYEDLGVCMSSASANESRATPSCLERSLVLKTFSPSSIRR